MEAAPPTYANLEGPSLDDNDVADLEAGLTSSFSLLTLSPVSGYPTADTCLAHLKLLFAIEALKTRIGNKDGLWDIWNSRATNATRDAMGRSGEANDVLALLKEKRWAVYVARAADRYAAWWGSFVPERLLESDMLEEDEDGKKRDKSERETSRYLGFTNSPPMTWTQDMLPPLDVLMVWHTHMLNPRLYLEDCLKLGQRSLWAAGMPWHLISKAIQKTDFQYVASHTCQNLWTEKTGETWANEDGPQVKKIKCPGCTYSHEIEWTTCGQPQDTKGTRKPGIIGQGYGDGDLHFVCTMCQRTITHDLLRVAKMRDDVINLVKNDWALPGTILDLETGTPKLTKPTESQLFPSRFMRKGLLRDMADILSPGYPRPPTMATVRDLVQQITEFNPMKLKSAHLKALDKDIQGLWALYPHKLDRTARVQTRKVMSRYWDNHSPFALDLCSAVMRQNVFVGKMVKLDWLHSPVARHTMERLIVKYGRFIDIIASNPGEVIVPTLEVDLGWHTHQLSTKDYYNFTFQKTKSFVDHDDKIDEDKLSMGFEWMTKTYQERYGEAYSECSCWYCESIRVMHAGALHHKQEKALKDWRASQRASNAESTQQDVHLSTHNAVAPVGGDTNSPRRVRRGLHRNKVDDVYEKTRREHNKLASKGKAPPVAAPNRNKLSSLLRRSSSKPAGVPATAPALPASSSSSSTSTAATEDSADKPIIRPRGDEIAAPWGKAVLIPGPWASETAVALVQDMYAAAPGTFHTGVHKPGVCAVGTCGGQTGCGTRVRGVCGAGCTGMGLFGSAGCGLGI